MSEENVEWVRQLAEALWHGRDPEAADALLEGRPAPDFRSSN
jgi:hypothetical protein